jgi:cytosine/adenosine deaminase-related metal-dependent hydrolase
MKKVGIELLLGTDNAMLNSPDILSELKYVKSITPLLSDEQLLNMITYTARKVLNLSPSILGPSFPADFVVLDKKTLKALYISYGR